VKAGVGARTSVTVIGDGAVGLCGVLAARRLGAERIVLMGRHRDRTDLGREFGATDVIAERGDEGIELVRDLTGGDGTHTVLECVGTGAAIDMALGVVRDGGVVSRVGAAQYTEVPMDFGTFFRNVTLTGGVAPARAYIEELMPEILDGAIQPGRVLDRTIGLEEVPDGYRAMAERQALKVLIRP
jgi:threonine dehydrogenase-like Zn-dependent dehydrogenase